MMKVEPKPQEVIPIMNSSTVEISSGEKKEQPPPPPPPPKPTIKQNNQPNPTEEEESKPKIEQNQNPNPPKEEKPIPKVEQKKNPNPPNKVRPLLPKPEGSNNNPVWWKRFVDRLARPWKQRDTSWCVPQENNEVNIVLEEGGKPDGLLYIKTYKASSSTCTGVSLSIAHNVARRLYGKDSMPCRAYTDHPFADAKSFGARDPKKSLLFSFVRLPHKRDLSQIFHMEIGRNKLIAANDSQAIIDAMDKYKGFQTTYFLPGFLVVNRNVTDPKNKWPRPFIRSNSVIKENVIKKMDKRVFDFYDFIGLTERMEESLAVMVLLWNLEPSDVIVLSSKKSGGYDDAGGKNSKCTLIPKAVTTPAIDDYLRNQHPLENIDYLLYHAVNKSLDLTIESLGADRVRKMVETIKAMQRIAEDRCQEEAQFPCSPTGEAQMWASKESCYHLDSGCGHHCIDDVLQNLNGTVRRTRP